MQIDHKEFLSAKEIADKLGVSVQAVHRLPVERIKLSSRVVRFAKADVEQLLEAARVGGGRR